MHKSRRSACWGGFPSPLGTHNVIVRLRALRALFPCYLIYDLTCRICNLFTIEIREIKSLL